jgi:hypothetical protein
MHAAANVFVSTLLIHVHITRLQLLITALIAR